MCAPFVEIFGKKDNFYPFESGASRFKDKKEQFHLILNKSHCAHFVLMQLHKGVTMRNKGLSVLLLSFTALSIGLPLSNGLLSVKAVADETSSLPDGWSVQTLDDTGTNPITSAYLSASAYNDSVKGNSLKLSRRISAYQLLASSDYFTASIDTYYKVEFSFRTECLNDDENVFVVTVLEKLTDGSILSSEVSRLNGRHSVWENVSGYYSTSENCESLAVRVSASGFGDFFVTDMTLKGRPSPFMSLMNFAMVDTETDPSSYTRLKPSGLTDDCYAGEKALKFSNSGVFMKLGFLPVGVYDFKFRYKHSAEAGSRGSMRLDNVSMDGTRLWYADAVPSNDTNGEWAEYTYRFQKSASGSCDISWMEMFFYGTYTIDELGIYDSEGYNYIPDGSFEGYDLPGVTLQGNVGIAKNADGSLNYAGCYETYNGNASPKIIYDAAAMDLEAGQTYTLSYECRNGYGNGFGSATYGENKLVASVANNETWTSTSVDFVATTGASLSFSLGDGWGGRLGYLKDISIKDSSGNECLLSYPNEHVTDESEIGDNIFPYGKFDYVFPDPEPSSSSSEDSYSGETRSEEESSSSIWSSSQGDSSSHSSQKDDSDKNGSTDSMVNATLTISIVFAVLAAAGLATSIALLIKGKKHAK